MNITTEHKLRRVVSIEYNDTIVETRDIVVDSEDHAFIAKHPVGQGVGISHNTAEIAFADPNDVGFRTMKSWKVDPVAVGAAPPSELKLVSEEDYEFYAKNMFTPEGKEIVNKYADEPWAYKFGGWRWASNNSVFATVGMDYTELAESIGENGEPGIAWLENMRNYSRMNNGPDYKDIRAKGGNPCLEQTLESNELCCLVETYPSRHQSAKDFYETLKVAYLYAKTVTLIATHNNETNTIICRNRRIGTSQSGIIDAIHKFGRYYFQKNMLDIAYDKIVQFDNKYSEWLGVPKSIKKSSVKPSGCTVGLTVIRTSRGNMTMKELFSLVEVDIDSLGEENRDVWILPDGPDIPRVYDMNNDEKEIVGFYLNGVQPVYDIEFEDGNFYQFTGEHKLLTVDGIWKRVDELSENDEIKSF